MVYALGCGRGLTSYLGEPAATPDEHIFLTVFANDGAFLCTNSLVITPPNTQSIFYKLAVSIDPECSAHVSGVVKFNDPLKLALEWDGQSTPLGASTSLFMAKSSQSSLGTGVEYEPPLSLHPNPCRDGFWLNKLGPVVRGSITIRMTDGKLIRSYDGIYSNAFVPTADMGPGVYSVVSVFDGTTSSQILTVLN